LNIDSFYNPLCNDSLFSKSNAQYVAPIDKSRFSVRSAKPPSFYDFLSISSPEMEKRIQYVRLVTTWIRTSRIISTTGGPRNDPWRPIFFPRHFSSGSATRDDTHHRGRASLPV